MIIANQEGEDREIGRVAPSEPTLLERLNGCFGAGSAAQTEIVKIASWIINRFMDILLITNTMQSLLIKLPQFYTVVVKTEKHESKSKAKA